MWGTYKFDKRQILSHQSVMDQDRTNEFQISSVGHTVGLLERVFHIIVYMTLQIQFHFNEFDLNFTEWLHILAYVYW